ncbi:hypothetical protein U1Q18_017788 [Sarracenia purpurea var. burkii]
MKKKELEKNEKPNVLSDIKASGTEASHEMGLMDIANVTRVTNDTQGQRKTSLVIAHEQIAGKTNPNKGIETTNLTGSIDELLMHAGKIQKPSERDPQRKPCKWLNTWLKRKLTGNKDEQQTETVDTVKVDEAKTDENKDDEEDGD